MRPEEESLFLSGPQFPELSNETVKSGQWFSDLLGDFELELSQPTQSYWIRILRGQDPEAAC